MNLLMSKNIVLYCDGTANEFKVDRTNVVKLCFATIKDHARQIVYYHPGVGTMAPPGFVTKAGALAARLAGLAFGYGLKNDIRDAYVFIMNHYQPGDRIFLFGFSRGAYTARAVAALLHLYGLVMAGNEGLIPYAVRMFWSISRDRDEDDIKTSAKAYFRLAREFQEALGSSSCPTHFLGVWDTVSSVGWVGSPVALPFTKSNPSVSIIRHAISIDEHRAFFRTNLFAQTGGHDVRQVWFPGVHCDVGGGYKEAESGLSKFALQWMACEAMENGLLVDVEKLATVIGRRVGGYVPADAKAKLHNSLTLPWWPAEFVPKRYWDLRKNERTWRLNLFRRRSMGQTPVVHDAAWDVGGDYASRLPSGAIRLSAMEWTPGNAGG